MITTKSSITGLNSTRLKLVILSAVIADKDLRSCDH